VQVEDLVDFVPDKVLNEHSGSLKELGHETLYVPTAIEGHLRAKS